MYIDHDPTTPNPLRFHENDLVCGQQKCASSGCYINKVIAAWEAENPGHYLPYNLQFDHDYNFFFYDDKIFYFKEKIFAIETLERMEQQPYLDRGIGDRETMDLLQIDPNAEWVTIRQVLAAQPPGMPAFIQETDAFLVFEDPGQLITTETMSSEILSVMQETFSEYCPEFFDIHHAKNLYTKNDQVYYTHLNGWLKSHILNFGVLLFNPERTFRYAYFYPDTGKPMYTEFMAWFTAALQENWDPDNPVYLPGQNNT